MEYLLKAMRLFLFPFRYLYLIIYQLWESRQKAAYLARRDSAVEPKPESD
jgi:hypothetical protein